MKSLYKNINYKFNNPLHAHIAMTHSSYSFEHKKHAKENNERYEFLGDAVLELVVTDDIFKKQKKYGEGKLTRLRAKIVCEENLSICAKEINIGEYLKLGNGEISTGGRERPSILSDAMEALIGAIYLDSGYESARKFINEFVISPFFERKTDNQFKDFKTQLQEKVQLTKNHQILYEVYKEEGPDHDKVFHVQVLIDDITYGNGIGKTKKEAEQEAAKQALLKYES